MPQNATQRASETQLRKPSAFRVATRMENAIIRALDAIKKATLDAVGTANVIYVPSRKVLSKPQYPRETEKVCQTD